MIFYRSFTIRCRLVAKLCPHGPLPCPALSPGRSNAHTVDWEGNAWYAGGISAKNLSLEEPIKTSELINDSEFITINDIPESNNLSAMVDGETLVLSSLLGQEIEEAINEIEAMIDESGVLDE